MPEGTFHFPRGFLWGTATAAFQVEGNNRNSNWWAWDHQQGRILEGHQSGLAADWWGGRWREDFDRAAAAGQNAHRLSVEWSRIQPTPDHWDESAIDRYREMLRGLLERGMLPLVTLHHFSDPLWISEQGGWENEKTIERFEKFVIKTVEALQEYSHTWVTLNEPNLLPVSAYLQGVWPPGKSDLGLTFQVTENLIRAHARAYHAIHNLQPHAQVGIAHHFRGFVPYRDWSPLDRLAAGMQHRLFNELFPNTLQTGVMRLPWGRRQIPEAKGTQDYFGLNYYTRDHVSFSLLRPFEMFGRRFYLPGADLSPTGHIANAPLGFMQAIRWALRFKVPILITENGVEDAGDQLRPRYLIQHLHQLWRAVNFNYPVKGYFHWTLVDNFEWERGWTQRFGLWELDPATQARRKRPSADLYEEICRENGISSAMVAKYAPELCDTLFPG